MMDDKLYNEIVENLRAKIESRYGTVKAFCDEVNLSRYNLSSIFHHRQRMSVGTYSTILLALGITEKELCSGRNSLPISDLLAIDVDLFTKSLIKVVL